jgi:hypothetical protein
MDNLYRIFGLPDKLRQLGKSGTIQDGITARREIIDIICNGNAKIALP